MRTSAARHGHELLNETSLAGAQGASFSSAWRARPPVSLEPSRIEATPSKSDSSPVRICAFADSHSERSSADLACAT